MRQHWAAQQPKQTSISLNKTCQALQFVLQLSSSCPELALQMLLYSQDLLHPKPLKRSGAEAVQLTVAGYFGLC